MCLNSKKRTFEVDRGKFLGFMITHQGIEVNINKYTTILKMHNLTNLQEVLKLNGKLASPFRFHSKLTEKAKPFYKLFKNIEPFLWDETCEQPFLAFKKTIVTPPVLSRPKSGVPLLICLSVTDKVVSSFHVHEEGKHQFPIFFTSCILHDTEKRYQMIETMTLALVTWARCLRPYF